MKKQTTEIIRRQPTKEEAAAGLEHYEIRVDGEKLTYWNTKEEAEDYKDMLDYVDDLRRNNPAAYARNCGITN